MDTSPTAYVTPIVLTVRNPVRECKYIYSRTLLQCNFEVFVVHLFFLFLILHTSTPLQTNDQCCTFYTIHSFDNFSDELLCRFQAASEPK